MSPQKYRLITRSDFDGLVCAVLLNEMNLIDEIKFVHPKDMQDGKIEVGQRDITTNLPYVPGAYLAFDHHLSETIRSADRYASSCRPFAISPRTATRRSSPPSPSMPRASRRGSRARLAAASGRSPRPPETCASNR